MKDRRWVWNPFRMISPKLHSEIGGIEESHEIPVSESHRPDEALRIMISKLIVMTKILSTWFAGESPAKLEECERLADEIHSDELKGKDLKNFLLVCERLADEIRRDEGVATSVIVGHSSAIGQNIFRIVVRFPSRVERIGHMCKNILNCCRIKAKQGIPFSDKALAELSGLFALELDMLTNLRDCLVVPNKILLQRIKEQGQELAQLVEDARFAHWTRLEAGFCSPSASSIYLEILDSFKFINEYINKMDQSLIEIAEATEGDPATTAV